MIIGKGLYSFVQVLPRKNMTDPCLLCIGKFRGHLAESDFHSRSSKTKGESLLKFAEELATSEHEIPIASIGDEVISDKQLDALLDRSVR
jgi:hypothetical protein